MSSNQRWMSARGRPRPLRLFYGAGGGGDGHKGELFRGSNSASKCLQNIAPSRRARPLRSYVRLTCNQGHGNATISPPKQPANGHHRPSPMRDISDRQGALDSNPPGLDKAPAHPASPRRTLRLLRSSRSLGPHPHQTEGASTRVRITRRLARWMRHIVGRFRPNVKSDTCVSLFISQPRGCARAAIPSGQPIGRTSNWEMNTALGLKLAR